MIIEFDTIEAYNSANMFLAEKHKEHLLNLGGDPNYECETMFGTPENPPYQMDLTKFLHLIQLSEEIKALMKPNEKGQYVLTDEMLDQYPHLK